ncbi:MAG: hypothetical protein H6Q89_1173 [Myxococcaceae bacterium]|nr:hypothetical protein [Myxococcaceae bacterium]
MSRPARFHPCRFGVVGLLLAASVAGAEESYEDRLIAWGLGQKGRQVEPHPAGKPIEELLVASEDVFSESDPWPSLFNVIHVRTREEVVLREILLKVGDRWDPALVAETERNLRRLTILAVARVVPVKGRNGGIGLLVVTKDRLSLRLNSFFNVQLSLFEFIGIILNRSTGKPEGSVGEVAVGRPITSLRQRWSFNVEGGWTVKTQRTFCGAEVCLQPAADGTDTAVPRIYDVRQLRAEASVTRSFGLDWRLDVVAAVGGYSRRYTAPQELQLTPAQLELLSDQVLPRSEDVTYLSAFVRFSGTEFRVLKNIDTYDLSEDYQLGPVLQLGARWAVPTISATHFVELGGALRYRWLAAQNLLTVSVAGSVRVVPGSEAVNRHVALEVVNASPPFEGGRLVTRVLLDVIKFDVNKRIQLLGGGNGLRGAPAESLSGRNLLLLNVEYRARAFELRTLFVGLVLFYDAGSAFDETIQVTHTLGLGLRILIPQFNQETIRFDFGFVIGGPERIGADRLNATYGQVTDLRPVFLDNPLGGGCDSPSCR